MTDTTKTEAMSEEQRQALERANEKAATMAESLRAEVNRVRAVERAAIAAEARRAAFEEVLEMYQSEMDDERPWFDCYVSFGSWLDKQSRDATPPAPRPALPSVDELTEMLEKLLRTGELALPEGWNLYRSWALRIADNVLRFLAARPSPAQETMKPTATVEHDTTLECDHCGCVAVEAREDGLFYDGDGGRCISCGHPGSVSCDSESEPFWNMSQEDDAFCADPDCEECNERRREAWAKPAPVPVEPAPLPEMRGPVPVRHCNRHDDCDAADAKAKAAGRPGADHCHDSCCSDCFGD